MELIGRIKRRRIYYVQIRNNPDWKTSLPKQDWVAFTIANKEDEELIPPIVKVCLDNNVRLTCSVGNHASMTEEYFDEEISWRRVEYEMKAAKKFERLVTTAHKNIGEGFWFAANTIYDDNFEINKVVCLDMTKRKLKKQIIELVEKINNGWLPNDNEF